MPGPQQRAAEAYRAFAPAVLGYLRSQRVRDAEDVLGEVFLHVARDIHRFDGDDASLRRWVFSIAHNRAMDDHRKAGRDKSTPSDDLADVGPEEHLPDPTDPELVDALGRLSPDQREVVLLRFVGDLPLEAVARVTGRKVGAVKALQHRALDNLRKAVSPPQV